MALHRGTKSSIQIVGGFERVRAPRFWRWWLRVRHDGCRIEWRGSDGRLHGGGKAAISIGPESGVFGLVVFFSSCSSRCSDAINAEPLLYNHLLTHQLLLLNLAKKERETENRVSKKEKGRKKKELFFVVTQHVVARHHAPRLRGGVGVGRAAAAHECQRGDARRALAQQERVLLRL